MVIRKVSEIMDNLDRAIVHFLQEDARMPFTEIAKELGVVEGTIRNRVAKLLESETLRLNATIDPHKAGFSSPAFIFVTVKPGSLERVAAELAKVPEVSYLVATTGDFDLLVEVMCFSSDHLLELIMEQIHQIEDISQTRTSMILKVFKELLPNLSNMFDE